MYSRYNKRNFLYLTDTTRLFIRTWKLRTTRLQHGLGHGNRTVMGRTPAADATTQQVHVCAQFYCLIIGVYIVTLVATLYERNNSVGIPLICNYKILMFANYRFRIFFSKFSSFMTNSNSLYQSHGHFVILFSSVLNDNLLPKLHRDNVITAVTRI